MNKLPQFKIRCSAIHKIMAGEVGLTPTQQERLNDYQQREAGTHPKGLKLTAKMEVDMAELQYKQLNPELPEGAKTYCKQWIKETLYKRREQVKSKYISKGNDTEEEGFTMMAVNLKLGFVQKNEEFRQDDFIMGACDLDHEASDTVFDNKSSWSLDQFPMFETEIPSKDYEAQIQGYCHLWKRKRGAVVYTLNDIPIDQLGYLMKPWLSDDEKQEEALNLIYTRKAWDAAKSRYFPNAGEVDFIEIPEKDRVKPFYFDYDPAFIEDVQERVKLCRKFIQNLLDNRQSK
jgi:hypothetical protein